MTHKAVPEYITGMRTLRDLLSEAVSRFGPLPALTLRGDDPLSYEVVARLIAAVQRALEERGAKPGARIALLADNRPEWAIAYLAVTTMGCTVVPILPDFSPGEVGAIVEHSGAILAIVSDSLRQKFDGSSGTAQRVMLEELVNTASPAAAGTPATSFEGQAPTEDDLAAIIYTSGTTGDPKGVMLSHRNIVRNIASARSVVSIDTEDRFLSVLPLAHSYECTIGFLVPLASGASITYLGRPPALSTLLPALAEVKPTMMLSVPLIMEKVYQARVKPLFAKNFAMRLVERIAPLRKLIHGIAGRKVYEAFGGSLRFFGIGGAPLSPKAERFLREGKFPYCIGYGLTETAPLVAGTDAEHARYRSTGPAIEGVEVRIESTGDESQGELLVRGPNVMRGYYRNDEATRAVLTEDGWFRTGDLVSMDRDGYLYIRGRLKNMIVGPSGENIYPGDIETVINEHELVVESLVFEWEGQLIARVHVDVDRIKEGLDDNADDLTETRHRADAMLEEIRAAVNTRVSRHARLSRMILQWEPFETTPTKKIKRFLYTTLGRQER
ncbi:MAG: AMP-binding protein [Spirochaetota bacterium]